MTAKKSAASPVKKAAAKKAAVTKTSAATRPPSKKSSAGTEGMNPSVLIDKRIEEIGGWRGETLARMRELIVAADSGIVEEWKWAVPVWSKGGIICTGESYKQVVKLTFAHGASLPDPASLFNSSLEGATRRAIDIREGETVNARAFTALIKAAVNHNAGT